MGKSREQLLKELEDALLRQARLEDELRQAREDTKAAKQARDTFLNHLNHEFRTPLNAIIGFADIALLKGPSARDPLYFELIKKSGVSLLHMVDNLLSLSSIVSGRERLACEAFHLHEFMDSVLDPYRTGAKNKGIELYSTVAPQAPTNLMGDPDNLRHALIKILDNAFEHTTEGHVRVSVTVVDGPSLADSVLLRFQVEDTGVGIPEDRLAKLLEEFATVGARQQGQSSGLGIGLATAKSLIELMGGDIWVESVAGRGSTFTFTISCGIC